MSLKMLKSTAVTGGMTLVSRVTGLLRDIIFASFLGASASISADAFYVAFRIPNFFRRIFGEGAFSQAFVPVCSEYKTHQDHEAVGGFIAHMSGRFALILFVFTAIGVIAAPILVYIMAFGYVGQEDKFDLTVQLLRIMFPYLFFISLVAMAAGILNTFGRFGVPAFTPVILNLCLIAAALIFAPYFGNPALPLAVGVFIAGVLQLLFQFPALRRLRLLKLPRLRHRHEGVSRVFKLMLPAIFGSSVSQLNMLVNTLLATFLVTGSVSWLYYSDRLMEFPLGVFGIALATVILPRLSKKYVTDSHEEFSQILDWALRWVFLIGLPATVGLMLLAGPMLATLFQYGKFNTHDVAMSARALIAFAVGLPGFMLIKVLAPGFYARQNTRTPAKIAAIAFLTNIVLSIALVFPLKHTGLALAISLAGLLNAGLLYGFLRKQKVYRPQPGWGRFWIQVLLATSVMGAVLYWGAGDLAGWLTADLGGRVSRLVMWVSIGAVVYVLMLLLTGIRPRELVQSVKVKE